MRIQTGFRKMRAGGVAAGVLCLWFLLPCLPSAFAQQVAVLIPNSRLSLSRSFVFADPSTRTLVLLYEKRTAAPGTLALEVRRQDNLAPVRRFSPRIRSAEVLRLAIYRPSVGIYAVVQTRLDASVLLINPQNGQVQRSLLYTLDEAHRLSSAVQRIDPAGLTWDDRLPGGRLLLNLPEESRTLALLATFNAAGARVGVPSRIDSGKGAHLDLAYNSCSGDLASTTDTVVRLLRSPRVQPLATPEEIEFDPVLCRYLVVRRPFTQLPGAYYLDRSLGVASSVRLPGSVAPQLIETTRNQAVYNAERHSFIYPTWAGHQRLYINEVTPGAIHTALLQTPIDTASMSVATQDNQVFLLLSGLQFGVYERFHRLILVRTTVP